MKRALITGINQLEIGEGKHPVPLENEVIVQVEACGICATDRHIFAGVYPIEFPITLGHEYAGTVVEIGSAVKTIKVGDRVAIDPNVVCGVCDFCRRGNVHLCAGLTPLGITRSGGYAEFSAVPEQNAYVMPDSMSFEAGGMLEPLSCAIRGAQLADVKLGDTTIVMGGGPMGVCLVQLLRISGSSRIIVVEPNPVRQKLALQLGADIAISPSEDIQEVIWSHTKGLGADIVFEASGNSGVALTALSLVKRGGTVMWFGCCSKFDSIPISPFWVNDAEITIKGSFNNPFTHSIALDLVSTGRVNVDALVTDRIPLDGLLVAMDHANFKNAMKVMIMPRMQGNTQSKGAENV